jgi:hypothetical protein
MLVFFTEKVYVRFIEFRPIGAVLHFCIKAPRPYTPYPLFEWYREQCCSRANSLLYLTRIY